MWFSSGNSCRYKTRLFRRSTLDRTGPPVVRVQHTEPADYLGADHPPLQRLGLLPSESEDSLLKYLAPPAASIDEEQPSTSAVPASSEPLQGTSDTRVVSLSDCTTDSTDSTHTLLRLSKQTDAPLSTDPVDWPAHLTNTIRTEFVRRGPNQVEAKQGSSDDTAMNGIRLICAKDERRSSTSTVESHTGFWGDWSHPQYCPSGVLIAFQLRVEGRQGGGDDTAVNNIRFRCSSDHVLEGPGLDWGNYERWSQVCVNGGICGIETKVEDRQGGGDDTALNDVRFHCCAGA
ncbi:uncharacterized protein LOC133013582 [Limanda limanda]|uniref:uncharacterized protein LOC133013582 n=1 Tax=Limanda limanda TaxID=27771 RepID=UPI0029C9571F|nr:uncharacterized protein LOC133013582 [Limanda limanda]